MTRQRLIPVGLWIAALGACLGTGLLTTPVTNDLTLFLPKPESVGEGLFMTEIGQGPAARVILMAIAGGSEASRAEASKRLAGVLRKSPLLLRVENGLRSPSASGGEVLLRYRYLLSPAIDSGRFSEAGLRKALQSRLADLGAPLPPMIKRLLPRDPTGELLAYLKGGRPQPQPKRHRGVWFSPRREEALLLAETDASAFDVSRQAAVRDTIDTAFAAIRRELPSEGAPLSLVTSGVGLFALDSRNTIKAEVTLLSILAATAVVGLLTFFFRSPLLVVLGALPLVSAVLAGWAAVGVFYEGIHGITLAFGVILVGVVLDYPIHVFTQLRLGSLPAAVVRNLWPTLRVSWLTTGLGFAALMVTGFKGLIQIGLFATAGILAAGLVTGWVLPHLIPAGFKPRISPPRTMIPLALRGAGRKTAWAVAVSFAVLVGATFALRPVTWELNLAALSPIPSELLQRDHTLRSKMGVPDVTHLAFVVAPDPQTALERSETLAGALESLRSAKVLSGYDMAALYLPSGRTQRERQRLLPALEQLRPALERAQRGLPFRPGLFEPFVAELSAARTLPILEPDGLAGTAIGLRVNSLLFQGKSSWLALVPLTGIEHPQLLGQWFSDLRMEGVHYLNIPELNSGLMARFRDEGLVRVAWGMVVMLTVLIFELRNWFRLRRVVIPVVLAVVVDLCVLLWIGRPLTLFHLFSILLIFGIGIDYCIFLSQPDSNREIRARTAHGLLICSMSTVLMFGALAFSQIPVLMIIGSSVSVGVTLSFVFAILFAQPASAGRGRA